MNHLVAYCDSATLARQNALIAAARRISQAWEPIALDDEMMLQWTFTGPGQPTLWDQLLSVLEPGEQWSAMQVISPFYAGPDADNRPMEKLVSLPGSEGAVCVFWAEELQMMSRNLKARRACVPLQEPLAIGPNST